jgi:hypothetical protein
MYGNVNTSANVIRFPALLLAAERAAARISAGRPRAVISSVLRLGSPSPAW